MQALCGAGEKAEIISKSYLSLCYRYDDETGLYYLQSRYYNPSWGRFINADGITGIEGQLLSHNIFVYCINNPIMMEDPSGFMHRFLSEDGDYTSTSLSSTIIASPITSGSVGATDNYISNTGLKPLSTNEANTILKGSGVSRASRRNLIRNIPKDMRDLKLPQNGSIKYQSSVGMLTTTAYGLVLLEDWKNNGNARSRVISIGIDTLGFGAGILAGGIIGSFSVPVWVGAGLVFGAGYGIGKGTSWVKGKFQVN